MGFYGLTPNTNYTLCIYLEHVRWYADDKDEEVLGVDNLSYRTFSTKPIPSNLITFTSVSADSTSVSFEFRVHPSTLGVEVDPYYQPDPYSLALFAEINDSSGSYYDSLMIENISTERESEYLICYGSFSGLYPSTTYTIKIMQSREQEYAFLGQTTFTTNTSIGHFETINVGSTTLMVPLVVPNEYGNDGQSPVGYNVYVTAEDIGGNGDTKYIQQWSTFDADHMIGMVTLENLYPATYYEIDAYASLDNDTILLAHTSVYTENSNGSFSGITINENASFYSHQFEVSLNYYDGGNVYQDFALTLKDAYWDTLGTFELRATTNTQTLQVDQSATQGAVGYEFDLNQVAHYSLSVYNNDYRETQTLDEGDVAFVNTDTSEITGVQSDWAMDLLMTTGAGILPIKLDLVDTAHSWDGGLTIKFEYGGNEYTSSLNNSSFWQYANISGTDLASVADGYNSFSLTIIDPNDNNAVVYEHSESVYLDIPDINKFTAVDLNGLMQNSETGYYTIGITEYDTDVGYTPYYIANVANAFSPTLVFRQQGTGEEYTYNMSIGSDPTGTAMIFSLYSIMDAPVGSMWQDYNDLKDNYDGKMFDIYVVYSEDSNNDTEFLVCEDFYFTFA